MFCSCNNLFSIRLKKGVECDIILQNKNLINRRVWQLDILEIKREMEVMNEKIQEIRGHLWPWKEVKGFKRAWRKNSWPCILEWQKKFWKDYKRDKWDKSYIFKTGKYRVGIWRQCNTCRFYRQRWSWIWRGTG